MNEISTADHISIDWYALHYEDLISQSIKCVMIYMINYDVIPLQLVPY